MSEQQTPYTAEEADALMLDAGTESPRYNEAIRKLVKDFGVQMITRYGEFMSDQSKHALVTAYQRTIPVAKKDFRNTVSRFIIVNTPTIKDCLLNKLADVVELLGVDTSRGFDFPGLQTNIGRISFLEVADLDEIIKGFSDDIREKISRMSTEESRKLILFYYILLPALHEAVHQGQNLSLPNSLLESAANYYALSYLKPDDIGKRTELFQRLIDRFGDDAHRLVFDGLKGSRRREIITVVKISERVKK